MSSYVHVRLVQHGPAFASGYDCFYFDLNNKTVDVCDLGMSQISLKIVLGQRRDTMVGTCYKRQFGFVSFFC